MNQAFNRLKFEAALAAAVASLTISEKATKDTLRSTSREVLEAHHATENVQYINALISVLSPVNRKTAVLFFQEFSGFHYETASMRFTKKDKKLYEQKFAAASDRLLDPHFNIWSWAEVAVKVEKAVPTLEGFTKYVKKFVLTAAGISHADMARAVFESGIKPEAIIEALEYLPGYSVKEEAVA